MKWKIIAGWMLLSWWTTLVWAAEPAYLSPTALVPSRDGQKLFIACATAHRVAVFDLASKKITGNIEVPEEPLGLTLSKDGLRLYVTCAAGVSRVCVIDTKKNSIIDNIAAGHTAMAPVLSPDEKTLYVCNRFNHEIAFIDLPSKEERLRVRVSREPVAAALTPNGKLLLVANHFWNSPTDGGGVGVYLSIVDTSAGRVVKKVQLPRGSGMVRGIAISPDGRFAAVTHLLARYYLATKEVESGRMNANALSLFDLERLQFFRFVQLDTDGLGAANPWGVAWAPDAKSIVVTVAGTHELSLIEAPIVPQRSVKVRKRIALSGLGPRAVAVVGTQAFVANYFTDNLSRIHLAKEDPSEEEVLELGPGQKMTAVRRGEMLFNDARLCLHGWQSCASCHDSDGRMDGLNWDLLNDGLGNPKNAKSLVWAHRTPPSMWRGVRTNAEAAVRAGIRHILFTEQPEEVAVAMDEYLKSLEPMPSPYLVGGKLSASAERGKKLFMDPEAGCGRCHPGPWFTDLRSHNVGTHGRYDEESSVRFDTPGLVELWRTSPYLHDSSAGSIWEVLTSKNGGDQHGKTSHLSKGQLEDLAEYLLSL